MHEWISVFVSVWRTAISQISTASAMNLTNVRGPPLYLRRQQSPDAAKQFIAAFFIFNDHQRPALKSGQIHTGCIASNNYQDHLRFWIIRRDPFNALIKYPDKSIAHCHPIITWIASPAVLDTDFHATNFRMSVWKSFVVKARFHVRP